MIIKQTKALSCILKEQHWIYPYKPNFILKKGYTCQIDFHQNWIWLVHVWCKYKCTKFDCNGMKLFADMHNIKKKNWDAQTYKVSWQCQSDVIKFCKILLDEKHDEDWCNTIKLEVIWQIPSPAHTLKIIQSTLD